MNLNNTSISLIRKPAIFAVLNHGKVKFDGSCNFGHQIEAGLYDNAEILNPIKLRQRRQISISIAFNEQNKKKKIDSGCQKCNSKKIFKNKNNDKISKLFLTLKLPIQLKVQSLEKRMFGTKVHG